jgi:hypothetical protein
MCSHVTFDPHVPLTFEKRKLILSGNPGPGGQCKISNRAIATSLKNVGIDSCKSPNQGQRWSWNHSAIAVKSGGIRADYKFVCIGINGYVNV